MVSIILQTTYATVAAPMTDLTHQGIQLKGITKCEAYFQ